MAGSAGTRAWAYSVESKSPSCVNSRTSRLLPCSIPVMPVIRCSRALGVSTVFDLGAGGVGASWPTFFGRAQSGGNSTATAKSLPDWAAVAHWCACVARRLVAVFMGTDPQIVRARSFPFGNADSVSREQMSPWPVSVTLLAGPGALSCAMAGGREQKQTN